MVYPVRVKKSKIFILADDFDALLKTIMKNPRAIGEAYRIKNFPKISRPLQIIELVNNTWGFLLKLDKNKKHISEIEYVWEKPIADELNFMKMISPFVEKNSYVVMFSEKGEMWRYFFNGSECKLQIPEIRWLNLDKEKNEN